MKILGTLLLAFAMVNSFAMKIDFGKNKDGAQWVVINDGVMGGLSKGVTVFNENSVIFKGVISLENNGGFTSFKSAYQSWNLSEYTTVKIRYKLRGAACAFSLENNKKYYEPNYKTKLAPTNNEWKLLNVNLTNFLEYEMGKQTGSKLQKKWLKEIIRIGFITAEKAAKDFQLEVDYIQFS